MEFDEELTIVKAQVWRGIRNWIDLANFSYSMLQSRWGILHSILRQNHSIYATYYSTWPSYVLLCSSFSNCINAIEIVGAERASARNWLISEMNCELTIGLDAGGFGEPDLWCLILHQFSCTLLVCCSLSYQGRFGHRKESVEWVVIVQWPCGDGYHSARVPLLWYGYTILRECTVTSVLLGV